MLYLVTYTSPTGRKRQWDVEAPGPNVARMAVVMQHNFKGHPSQWTVEPLDKPSGK